MNEVVAIFLSHSRVLACVRELEKRQRTKGYNLLLNKIKSRRQGYV